MGVFTRRKYLPAGKAETPQFAAAAARQGQVDAQAKAQANSLRSMNMLGAAKIGQEGYEMYAAPEVAAAGGEALAGETALAAGGEALAVGGEAVAAGSTAGSGIASALSAGAPWALALMAALKAFG